MSARIEVPQIHRGLPGAGVLVAVVVAAVVGGLVGSAITQALGERTVPAPVAAGVSSTWDAGMLQAMEGRQLAAEVRTTVPVWDIEKLEAMAGRQVAAGLTTAPVPSATRWNGAKLEAMQGTTR